MEQPDKILGFDVRRVDATAQRRWDDRGRRDLFLLRTDVETPLSGDVIVWPSAWSGVTDQDLIKAARGPTGLQPDLQALQLELSQKSVPTPSWVIAIAEPASTQANATPFLKSVSGSAVPSQADSAWELLGYDIADSSLMSGLMNCGHPPNEVRGLREEWVIHLNEHHLFSHLEPAERFRDLSDKLFPEHSLFFVFSLFTVSRL